MQANSIQYSEVKFLSSLIQDYLFNPNLVSNFFAFEPNLNGFKKAIESRSFAEKKRGVLVSELLTQYQGIPNCNSQLKAIESLLKPNTFTVTTGHQLCTFTGPSYFVYKILSVVKLAQQLKVEFPENNFVPVYWMATEDHDFDEINHFFFDKRKFEWSAKKEGAVGEVEPELAAIEKELEELWKFGDHGEDLRTLFKESYAKSNLAEATQWLVHKLLGEYGVVIIDANKKSLKQLFVPQILQELKEATAQKKVDAASVKLKQKGYSTQVNARDVNLFYLTSGARKRIQRSEKGFELVEGNKNWDLESITKEVEEFPERFSPNVILRPLYQECILPNLSYSGGAGEMSYWFQLKDMFDAFNIDFPILMLRNSALVLSKKGRRNTEKLGLTLNDLFKKIDVLEKHIVDQFSTQNFELAAELDELIKQFSSIKNSAMQVDKGLDKAVEATQTKTINLIERLKKKMIRAEKRNLEIHYNRLYALLDELFPNGSFQERKLNFSTFYYVYGNAYFEKCLEAFDPLNPDISVIRLD